MCIHFYQVPLYKISNSKKYFVCLYRFQQCFSASGLKSAYIYIYIKLHMFDGSLVCKLQSSMTPTLLPKRYNFSRCNFPPRCIVHSASRRRRWPLAFPGCIMGFFVDARRRGSEMKKGRRGRKRIWTVTSDNYGNETFTAHSIAQSNNSREREREKTFRITYLRG